jgi:hypothetical protein
LGAQEQPTVETTFLSVVNIDHKHPMLNLSSSIMI